MPGFGCVLLLERNWASLENTKRSYEMLARYVLPAVNGDNAQRQKSFDWAGRNAGPFTERFSEATRKAFEKHERGGR